MVRPGHDAASGNRPLQAVCDLLHRPKVSFDRTTGWIKLTEWDTTYAFTGIVEHWGWRLQYERDAPLDRCGLKQIYADAVLTYRFRAEEWAWWRSALPAQNITGYLGPGWLFFNHSYFARPDNSGLALLRYIGAWADVDLYYNRIVAFVDLNMFTDRTARNEFRPSELDWILGLACRWHDLEFSVYREQDRPRIDLGLYGPNSAWPSTSQRTC